MLAPINQAKVLLCGNISRVDRRSQALIEFLSSSKNYFVSQLCPSFYYINLRMQSSLIEKVLTKFYWVELLIKAAFTDVIYLLPMNTIFIKSTIFAAKLFRKKVIVEMYISLYDTEVRDRKRVGDGSKLAKSYIEKDILALKKSDYLIHSSNQELTYWEQILNTDIDRKKVYIAPLCNVSCLLPNRSWMQDGKLNICWWGTFIPLHGLDNILQAIRILRERNLHFTCNFFGIDNKAFYDYVEKVRSYHLESIVFLRKDLNFINGSLPKYLVNYCDLALGIFGNTDKAYHALPNKLIEALSLGLPTLTMNSPALREFFNPETELWTCENTPESIAESILSIASGSAYSVDWKQTREKVLETFSLARYTEVVSEVLAKATNNLPKKEVTRFN
ncbi:hypothetical protein DSM107010_41920 [Chroococcidiopsis cubana SAG 39.79]|uniref:Glycosyl transferase family 1 domain-containing protein n=2 Tax=Chroococcidiopsis TaxID=54298 RepID=A0AB37UGS4_9CYAN|nr:glycosyltransferase [Chroococcidiopsis cubana]PSB65198.1 group 1 glycosyl transferase [Chroococcidiopsis cubana CCALA 043]RUT10506.1 hypothetical protein DSM107010_41920 [Chroococcidiopsis cubana SAG 39.79]